MSAVYPHCVDYGNTTIGGLLAGSQFVNMLHMKKKDAEDPPFIDIARRLIAIREAFSDLNQKEWAAKHGFSQTQYNNWETGKRRITVDEAERLAELYGLTLDFVYRGRRDGLSDTASKKL